MATRKIKLTHPGKILREQFMKPVGLSAYLGTSDGYWINLQAHFDLEMAKDKVGKQAARISPHPHDETGALRPV
jgi:plasmid maintenance system antidote protein VapI